VIYAHGNAKDRCSKRRIGNYRVLREAGYDVMAIDYGGFSNSTLDEKNTFSDDFPGDFLNKLQNQFFNQPTPDTLSNDIFSTVEYVSSRLPHHKIILWGHSLGTSAVSRAISLHSETISKSVKIAVLEAPFADALSASKTHPLTSPFRNIYSTPVVNWAIDLVAESAGLYKLASLNNLKSVTSKNRPKMLVLHSADDDELGVWNSDLIVDELVAQEIAESGEASRIRYLRFGREKGYGHSGMLQNAEWQEELACLLDDEFCQIRVKEEDIL